MIIINVIVCSNARKILEPCTSPSLYFSFNSFFFLICFVRSVVFENMHINWQTTAKHSIAQRLKTFDALSIHIFFFVCKNVVSLYLSTSVYIFHYFTIFFLFISLLLRWRHFKMHWKRIIKAKYWVETTVVWFLINDK